MQAKKAANADVLVGPEPGQEANKHEHVQNVGEQVLFSPCLPLPEFGARQTILLD